MANIHKQTNFKSLSSNHKVSADGSHIIIDGKTFKRKVLPSVALPSKDDETIQAAIEEFDQIRAQEIDTSDTAEWGLRFL